MDQTWKEHLNASSSTNKYPHVFFKKNKQYYLIQIQTFPPQIQIQMCEPDSDLKPLNKQTAP